MVMMSGFGVGELDGKLIHRTTVLIYLTFLLPLVIEVLTALERLWFILMWLLLTFE